MQFTTKKGRKGPKSEKETNKLLDINFYLDECYQLLKETRRLKESCGYYDLQEFIMSYADTAMAYEDILYCLPKTMESNYCFLYAGLIECYNNLAIYTLFTNPLWIDYRLKVISLEAELKALNCHRN